MIDLRDKNQDELETFVRKIKKGGYQKGVMVAYHEGNAGDMVNATILGKIMWSLAGYKTVKVRINDDEGNAVLDDGGNEQFIDIERHFKEDQLVNLVQRKVGFERFVYMGVVR